MIQSARCAGLLFKAPQPLGIVYNTGRQNFDSDRAIEPCVSCSIDLAHTTGSEWSNDFVWAKFCAGFQVHGRGHYKSRIFRSTKPVGIVMLCPK